VVGLMWTATGNIRNLLLFDLPSISREISDQMCRIRDLVDLAPKTEPVVLNDVGCTTFFLDHPIVDLYGLTTYDARALGGKELMTKAAIDALVRRSGAKMAVVYKEWFTSRIPDDWVEIGHWTTATTKYAAKPTITVFATNPQWKDEVAGRWGTFVENGRKSPYVRFFAQTESPRE
jgi:hypothetical protein